MSLSERLAFLISVNGTDAIRGFQQIGDSAEKNLGKADKRIDKFSSTATKVGAGMLAFSGVAGGALLAFAKASEEANRSHLELENTLSNAPQLAGATAGEFEKLATSIQNKTAADGDAIVSGIAVLGQFGLTARQLQTLTPLLVDYSRRTGKDMVTSAQVLGKALQGQGRGLRDVGIQFTDTGSSAGNFAEIVDSLSDKVGGFAEQEGKTFSGSLERLKNQFGDIEEGVGKGAVDVFGNLLVPVEKVSAAFADTSPEVQDTLGKLASIGTISTAAVGGLSLIAGQLLKLRDRFTTLEDGVRSFTTIGKFAAGAGLIGGIAGVVTVLTEVAGALHAVHVNAEELARSTTSSLVASFDELDASSQKAKNALDPAGFAQYQRNLSEKQGEFFQSLAEQQYATAIRLRDALKARGEDVSQFDKILKEEARAQRQASSDAKAGADAFDDVGKAAAGAVPKVDSLAERLSGIPEIAFGIQDAQEAVDAGFEDLTDSAKESGDKQADVWKKTADAARDYADVVEQANRRVRDAHQAVSDAQEDLNKISSGDRTAARRRLRDAQQEVADAEKDRSDNIAEAAQKVAEAKQNTDEWTGSLDSASKKGRETRDAVQQIVEKTVAVATEMSKQGRPASEIVAYIQAQYERLQSVGTQIGLNKQALEEFLAVLKFAEGLAQPVTGAGFALGSFGLGGDAVGGKPSPGGFGAGVNVFVINQPGSVADPDFARAVGNEVHRQLPRGLP